MTLKDIMTADMPVFLNTDEFAETWTQWPANVQANAVEVTVVPVPDSVEGRDVPGDGRSLHKPAGTKIRETLHLWMVKSVQISEPEGAGSIADRWIDPNGVIYSTIRVIGHDIDMQKVLVSRIDRKSTRRGDR